MSGLHPSEQDPVLGCLLFNWCIWEILGYWKGIAPCGMNKYSVELH